MRTRPALFIVALSLLLLSPLPTASAQQIHIENGATLHMSNGGVWDLQGTTLNFGDAGATAHLNETPSGRVTGGRLTAARDVDIPSSTNVAGLGVEISASVDLGTVTVTRGHARHTLPGRSASSIKRFYDVSPSRHNRGLNATLTVHYADAELNALSESDLAVFKSDNGGGTWRPRGSDGRDAVANTVTLQQVRSLSRWTLGPSVRGGGGPPFDPPGPPSGLASGQSATASMWATAGGGGPEGNDAVVHWQATAERRTTGFQLQHKGPVRKTWSTVHSVESKAPIGSETGPHAYRWSAEDLAVGTHQFRLRRVASSGTAALIDTAVVRVHMQKALRLTPPAPNPVRSDARLRFGAKDAPRVMVALYDVLGRRVRTVFEGRPPPGQMQAVRIDAGDLPAGMYFVRLTAEGMTRTQPLTVVR